MRTKTANRREGVILSILLNGEKYGREIADEYKERTGNTLPLGSLYVTLDRMESKGFLRGRLGESSHERGGNRRKYFKITGIGHRALDDFMLELGLSMEA